MSYVLKLPTKHLPTLMLAHGFVVKNLLKIFVKLYLNVFDKKSDH